MSKLDQQFLEDRALRDAAKKNVLADVELLKAGWNERGLAKRVTSRIGGGAKDVFEKASDAAEDNRGVLGALIGAVILWFASGALLDLLGEEAEAAEEPEGTSASAISQNESDDEPDIDVNIVPAPQGDKHD